jgi:hypothetical protein
MKVFISWSGERSGALAQAIYDWLPTVIQSIDPWLSKSDLNKGVRWGVELAAELENTQVGIICVTPDNAKSPWLLFEAGALSKTLPDTHVCPLLLDLQPTDFDGPLTQFQATIVEKNDLKALVNTINAAQKDDDALPREILDKVFERAWPDLNTQLMLIPKRPVSESQVRPMSDMVREILGIIRLQAKEAESREDDYYKSRDSFMALLINLLQNAGQGTSNLPPDVARNLEEFKRYASAYFLHKRDISECPDCQGTGYSQGDNMGVRRCEHERLNTTSGEAVRQ